MAAFLLGTGTQMANKGLIPALSFVASFLLGCTASLKSSPQLDADSGSDAAANASGNPAVGESRSDVEAGNPYATTGDATSAAAEDASGNDGELSETSWYGDAMPAPSCASPGVVAPNTGSFWAGSGAITPARSEGADAFTLSGTLPQPDGSFAATLRLSFPPGAGSAVGTTSYRLVDGATAEPLSSGQATLWATDPYGGMWWSLGGSDCRVVLAVTASGGSTKTVATFQQVPLGALGDAGAVWNATGSIAYPP